MNARRIASLLALGLVLLSCNLPARGGPPSRSAPFLLSSDPASDPTSQAPTPLPTRTTYKPGQLVDYTAQTGDTLPALAARFNTGVAEIMAANPLIPSDATTLPPGLPMKIPIYYKALWASPFKILPDAAFVNGPAQIGFNTSAFVAARPGWLKDYRAYAGGEYRSGAEIVEYVAQNFSLSPRLLLALLEYQAGALSRPQPPASRYPLGYETLYYEGVYLQLVWAANTLNNGYYGWRSGRLTEFYQTNGAIVRPDPWQNAASVGIQYLFSRLRSGSEYEAAVGPAGFASTYQSLFGEAWNGDLNLIPGSLRQPDLHLPFRAPQTWTLTGGPHTGWGRGEPLAAIDFAPPSEFSGCFAAEPEDYVTAVADGLVVRSSPDGVVLDLDKDGDERTGWVIFYLHLATHGRAPLGRELKAGELIGYPSCEGGETTGTHVHIARKYNGEWILADGPLAFNLEGWVSHNGQKAYQGTLTRNGVVVRACECSDAASQITAEAGAAP